MVICCASCSGVLPEGTKPVVFAFPPDLTTTTTTAAIATTTTTIAAMMMFRFLFVPPPPRRACRDGACPMTGSGEVGGSDAYHGPDDLLPPESLVTHATVPTSQLRHKRFATPAPDRGENGGFPRPVRLRIFDMMSGSLYIHRVKIL